MLAELGFFSLILVAVIAITQISLSLWGEMAKKRYWLQWNAIFSYLQCGLVLFSFGCLVYAFASNDFSVSYVAHHSNSQLPLFFKLAASWGGHEGSMLFWLCALNLWSALFAFFSRKIEPLFRYRTLAMLGLISLGFTLFILLLSNPFVRGFPALPEGRDLNPMLQDVGLIFHPPLLYLGYVGFSVSFSMVIATLLSGVLDAAVARWIRPWVMLSWGFLSAGIILGAWWAYYELGWGGWWFWDPVENASLMPWLLGTALLHSLIVSEQRGTFNYWTILLAIFAFALSLLGTFIVRSGVLTSVHAFAVDADRGLALLLLFFSLSFIALALFAFKANLWSGNVRFQFFSKETVFLLINGLFSVATSAVVLGTFYPMVFTAMQWGAISVGAPYFNSIFMPLVLLVMLLMGFAVNLRWKSILPTTMRWQIWSLPLSIALALLLILPISTQGAINSIYVVPVIFISLSCWILLTHIPIRKTDWLLRRLPMRIAHIGFALCVIGAMTSSYYGDEKGVRLKLSDKVEFAGFEFQYQQYQDDIGKNFTAEQALFTLKKQGKFLTQIMPERRYYDVRTMTMSEVGLYHHNLSDVYIVMGDKFGHYEYAFRLHYKPYVSLLWIGAVLLVIASFLALLNYTRERNKR